jgi:hypothetical protein
MGTVHFLRGRCPSGRFCGCGPAFYEALGFRLDEEHSSATALEIVNESGVRMNLILNGEPTALRDNVLMDVDSISAVAGVGGKRTYAKSCTCGDGFPTAAGVRLVGYSPEHDKECEARSRERTVDKRTLE